MITWKEPGDNRRIAPRDGDIPLDEMNLALGITSIQVEGTSTFRTFKPESRTRGEAGITDLDRKIISGQAGTNLVVELVKPTPQEGLTKPTRAGEVCLARAGEG